MPEFEQWLRPVLGNNLRARYRICNHEFVASLKNIRIHAESDRYIRAIDLANGIADEREERISEKVNRALIKLSAVFAENNLAFILADNLTPVLK